MKIVRLQVREVLKVLKEKIRHHRSMSNMMPELSYLGTQHHLLLLPVVICWEPTTFFRSQLVSGFFKANLVEALSGGDLV
jgi:hypothetical protein